MPPPMAFTPSSLPFAQGAQQAETKRGCRLRVNCRASVSDATQKPRLREDAVRDRRYKDWKNLVAEGYLHVAGGLHQLTVGRDESQAIDGLSDRHVAHLVILITHHRTELLFVN